jgi:hypothetical protein
MVDLLRPAGLGCMIVPVIIAGGGQASTGLRNGYESVSRSETLTRIQVLVPKWRREMLGLKLGGEFRGTR